MKGEQKRSILAMVSAIRKASSSVCVCVRVCARMCVRAHALHQFSGVRAFGIQEASCRRRVTEIAAATAIVPP